MQAENLQSLLMEIKRKKKSALRTTVFVVLFVGVIGMSLLGYSAYQVNKRLQHAAMLDQQIEQKTQQLNKLEEQLDARNKAIYQLSRGEKNITGRWRDADNALIDITQNGNDVTMQGIDANAFGFYGTGKLQEQHLNLSLKTSGGVMLLATLRVSDDGNRITGTIGSESGMDIPVSLNREP